jgi:hypothetical protein
LSHHLFLWLLKWWWAAPKWLERTWLN